MRNMEISAIATIRSPYKQKFAIHRQPGLVSEAVGEIVFHADYADPNCLRGIEGFSHLWLLFRFHETVDKGWTPTVQPPRLGGKERVGVFATRSTFRPNGIGLSVVENLGWRVEQGELILSVGGIDLLDGTPIVDIKPYLPYADSLPEARGGFAGDSPGSAVTVNFEAAAQSMLDEQMDVFPDLRELIINVLQQDPRPAWRKRSDDAKRYGMSLYDLNIKWKVDDDCLRVLEINKGDAGE